jgi:hypothetical protein
MERSYRLTSDSAFIVEPGVSAKVLFDEHGGACTFTLFGDMSEDKVLQTFEMLVPAKERSSPKPHGGIMCMGACIQTFFYKAVTLSTGSIGDARSYPAAIQAL